MADFAQNLDSPDDIALADQMNNGRKADPRRAAQADHRPARRHGAGAADAVRRRQQPDHRRPRPGQDAADPDAGAGARAEVQAHPVHARPDAVRHHRHRHHPGRPSTGRRQMVFAPGPIFSNIVLADEINRTPPKTQSALLEAMQEHRVTIQGRTYQLEEPFYVFATQNPIELEGTYPAARSAARSLHVPHRDRASAGRRRARSRARDDRRSSIRTTTGR